MLALYNAALLPLRLVAECWSRLPSGDPARRCEWEQRLARRLPEPAAGSIWIHGASVGEARIVAGVARTIRAARPDQLIAVSAVTRTGRSQLPAPPDVETAFFSPLDFAGLAGRLLQRLKPSTLVLVETELWPNLLGDAFRLGVPVVMVNGRLSPRRMKRYRRLKRLYGPLLAGVSRIGAQSDEDARRFVELGASPDDVVTTGNVKYDLPLPDDGVEQWRRRVGVSPGRPVFVAGSTAPGEEVAVLDACDAVRDEQDDLLLILAPRHLDRLDEVELLLDSRKLAHCRLSRLEPKATRDLRVVLVDTLGQLFGLYQLARIAFVGGSLVPVGGHNVLEPAAVGVPVLFGPHTENFVEPAADLERAGGGLRVADADALGSALRSLLGDAGRREEMARRAEAVVESNRGALERSVSLVLEVSDRGRPHAGIGTA